MKINVLSYNIFIRPPPIRTNQNDYKSERLKIFCHDMMKNYDIICFQELFGLFSNRRKYVQYMGRKHGLKHCGMSTGSWFSMRFIDSGLVVLSRYPIVEEDAMVFSSGAYVDAYSHKGVVFCCIQLPNKELLLVFNTHFQSDYTHAIDQYWMIQQQQFVEVREFIKEKKEKYPSGHVILLGDMNVDSGYPEELAKHEHSIEYKRMLSELNHSFIDVLYKYFKEHPVTYGDARWSEELKTWIPLETTLTPTDANTLRHSIDYILWSPSNDLVWDVNASVEKFSVEDKPFTQLSDHYGITLELEFNWKSKL